MTQQHAPSFRRDNMEEQRPEMRRNAPAPATKTCAYCGEAKPVSEFLRRTGKRSGKGSRRGACRSCRSLRKQQARMVQEKPRSVESPAVGLAGTADAGAAQAQAARQSGRPDKSKAARHSRKADEIVPKAGHDVAGAGSARRDAKAASLPAAHGTTPKRRIKRALPAPPPRAEGPDVRTLRPNRNGMIRMRGRTDKGRRWQQEVDFELAVTLVREHAAVVVNPHTIRRLYTNKAFRNYILTRDNYTCFFCGEYGDTIDHLLPKAKGGHTTPVNCVCACNLCNQSKADQDLEDFIEGRPR